MVTVRMCIVAVLIVVLVVILVVVVQNVFVLVPMLVTVVDFQTGRTNVPVVV